MYCHRCGSRVPDGSSFCPSCGASLTTPRPLSSALTSDSQETALHQPDHLWRSAVQEILSEVEYAGFWRRLAASIIDGLVLTIPGVVVGFVIGFGETLLLYSLGTLSEDAQSGLISLSTYLAALVINWLYFAVLESSSWQATMGKRALGIIVTDEHGERLTFARATGRHFAKFLSGLVLYIGFLMAGWTSRKQAIHDMVANTLVVMKPR